MKKSDILFTLIVLTFIAIIINVWFTISLVFLLWSVIALFVEIIAINFVMRAE
jgi:hypothetical protein